MIEIHPQLTVPEHEIAFRTSRSSGPGGQNVNKVESRVELLFDLEASESLKDEQRERLRERLATRISRSGVLRVVSQKYRTQAANKDAALRRFVELVAEALEEAKPRKPKRKPKGVERRRLQEKRRQSEKKKLRSRQDRWQE